MEKSKEIIYTIYYRLYFVFIAFWIIKYPKPIKKVPESFVEGQIEVDSDFEDFRHHHFIIIPQAQSENRWLFWQRHFAYQIKGTKTWIKLPSFTPKEMKDGEVKYGFNTTLYKKIKENSTERKIISWR